MNDQELQAAQAQLNNIFGLIAEMLQSYEDEDTPLQQKLEQLGKVLGTACLGICGIVFIYGLIRDTHPGMIFDQGFLHYLSAEKMDIVKK